MKRERLDRALEKLRDEGVLDAPQHDRVHAELSSALFASSDPVARFVAIIGGLGGVLIGMGLIYLVGYNWQELGKVTQLGLLFTTLFGLHGVGYYLSEGSRRAPAIGRAFTTAGVLAFGAAIFLVAQIYHVQSEYPTAVLLWWGLNVPIVLFTASVPILYVVTGLGLTWVFWHTGVWIESATVGEGPVLAALALVAVGAGALLVGLAGLARRSRWSSFAPHLGAIGVLVAVFAPYALSFQDVSFGYDDRLDFLAYVPFLICGLAALIAAALNPSPGGRVEALQNTGMVAGTGALLALSLALHPPTTFLVANAVLLAGAVGLVAHGVAKHRSSYVNLGVAVFAMSAVTRYFEYLWDKLEGSFAFLITGALLLGLVMLVERRRRSWTRTAKEVPA